MTRSARASSDDGLRIGVAHHLGWAVVVTARPDHTVVDRRRVELLEDGLPSAPVHHEGGPHEMHRSGPPLDDDELATLVARVRAAAMRATTTAFDDLARSLPSPIASVSVRDWPDDFPIDVAVLRRAPHEARADSVMYCQVIAEVAASRGWAIHRFDARTVEHDALAVLGARGDDVLRAPRSAFGPPWAKDHRMALAATIVATVVRA